MCSVCGCLCSFLWGLVWSPSLCLRRKWWWFERLGHGLACYVYPGHNFHREWVSINRTFHFRMIHVVEDVLWGSLFSAFGEEFLVVVQSRFVPGMWVRNRLCCVFWCRQNRVYFLGWTQTHKNLRSNHNGGQYPSKPVPTITRLLDRANVVFWTRQLNFIWGSTS